MLDFFKKMFAPERSSETAKERLRLVLISDQLALSPEVVEALKNDLFAVISRYVEIDSSHADLTFEHREREIAMLANIPILGVRDRAREHVSTPLPAAAVRPGGAPTASGSARYDVAPAAQPAVREAVGRGRADRIARIARVARRVAIVRRRPRGGRERSGPVRESSRRPVRRDGAARGRVRRGSACFESVDRGDRLRCRRRAGLRRRRRSGAGRDGCERARAVVERRAAGAPEAEAAQRRVDRGGEGEGAADAAGSRFARARAGVITPAET